MLKEMEKTLIALCMFTSVVLAEFSHSTDTWVTSQISDGWSNCTTSDSCSNSSKCTHTSSRGCILVTNVSDHTIVLQNSSSIINLTMFLANESQPVKGNLQVHIAESSQWTATWNLDREQNNVTINYISGTPTIVISVTSEHEWTDLVFVYEEIQFEIHVHVTERDTGALSTLEKDTFHRPNTLTLFQLNPQPRVWNESSVTVTVHKMTIDEAAGEYILIGAGDRPFDGAPAAFLTERITKSEKYYVAAESVYILFYHISKKEPYFLIRWTRSGKKIEEPEEKPDKSIPDSVLQAVPICFYNASWIEELNSTDNQDSALSRFQEKFADVANQYVKEKRINILQKISPKSVQILRVSSIFPPDENFPYGTIYAMLTIVREYDSKLAIFRWFQVAEIVKKFDSHDAKTGYVLGFKVGKCQETTNYKWWYVATALLLLLTSTFFLGVWICAYNTVWKSKKFKMGSEAFSKRLSSLHMPGTKKASKDYVAYQNPTITLSDEKGYNVHLNNGTTAYTNVLSDEDSEAEIFNSNWIMKKRETRTELPKWEGTSLGHMHKFNAQKTDDKMNMPNLLWKDDKMGSSLQKVTVKLEQRASPEAFSEESHSLQEDADTVL